jgi:hypothetical protein
MSFCLILPQARQVGDWVVRGSGFGGGASCGEWFRWRALVAPSIAEEGPQDVHAAACAGEHGCIGRDDLNELVASGFP